MVRRTALAAVCFLLPILPLRAQWTLRPALDGGTFHHLAAADGGLLASTGSTLFRFDGAAWTVALADFAGAPMATGAEVFVPTAAGLQRSRDGGRTYEAVALPPRARFLDAAGLRLTALREDTVLVSTDAGATWTSQSGPAWVRLRTDAGTGPPLRVPLGNIARVVGHRGGLFAAATAYVFGDVYRRAPGDTMWTPVLFRRDRMGEAARVTDLVEIGGRLVALTSEGVRASADGGATWTALDSGLPAPGGLAARVFVAGTGALYLCEDAAFYRLDGDRWTVLPALPTGGATVLAAAAGEALYASIDREVLRLDGDRWTALPRPVATSPRVLHAASASAAVVSDGGRLLRTTDGGATFAPFGPPGALDARFVTDALVFARDPSGPVRSTDGGATWLAAGRPPAPSWLGALPPGESVVHGGAVYSAFGANWCVEHCTGQEQWGGIFRTLDGGATWTDASAGLPRGAEHPRPIRGLFSDGTALLAVTDGGCVRSTGGAWTAAACPAGAGGARIVADGARWIALGSVGVSVSADRGASWSPTTGLPAGASGVFEGTFAHLLPTAAGARLVADAGGSAHVFRLDGTAWVRVSAPAFPGGRFPEGVRWTSLALSLDGTTVYGGSFERGLWTAPAHGVTRAETPPAPLRAGLSPATPSPLRRAGRLSVTLAEPADARVDLFDALGRRVAVLHDGPLAAGTTVLGIDAGGLAAGVYLVQLRAGALRATQAVVVAQ